MDEDEREAAGEYRNGMITLFDLAGYEQLKESGAEDDAVAEATHINNSLSARGAKSSVVVVVAHPSGRSVLFLPLPHAFYVLAAGVYGRESCCAINLVGTVAAK